MANPAFTVLIGLSGLDLHAQFWQTVTRIAYMYVHVHIVVFLPLAWYGHGTLGVEPYSVRVYVRYYKYYRVLCVHLAGSSIWIVS